LYIQFSTSSEYKIYDYDLKNTANDDVSPSVATNLQKNILEKCIKSSQKIIEMLNIKDFGRLDFRVSDSGGVYFLEINSLLCLELGSSMYISSSFAGIKSEEDVISKILESSIKRYGLKNI